jgi:hypothetical protein
MAKKWIKITPGVITGYFRGKRLSIKQGDCIDDEELVKIYPHDFNLVQEGKPGSPPPSSPASKEAEPTEVQPPSSKEKEQEALKDERARDAKSTEEVSNKRSTKGSKTSQRR